MGTVRSLLKRSLQDLGVLGAGEAIDGDQVSDLLDRFNNMLSLLSTQGAVIFTDTLVSKVLTANDGEYTIGTGGDIDTTKPVRINDAYIRLDNNDTPVEIIDELKYNRIAVKTTTGRPKYLYHKTGHPLGTLKLHPVPSQAYTLLLDVQAPLSTVALDDALSLPAGYEETLEYLFALRCEGTYGKTLSLQQTKLAEDGLENIKAVNRGTNMFLSTTDAPGQGRNGGFDVNTRSYT